MQIMPSKFVPVTKINMWGPWHTATHKAEGSLADVKISVEDMISPKNVMDIFQFFTMFATDKKYRKYKIICRYQQFEGANMIVNRVIAGYPKKGLIWHFQGSGKSLLMVFAAQKLRMIPELKNPTVVIVDDRNFCAAKTIRRDLPEPWKCQMRPFLG